LLTHHLAITNSGEDIRPPKRILLNNTTKERGSSLRIPWVETQVLMNLCKQESGQDTMGAGLLAVSFTIPV
jgi:hypothetical protein